MVYLSVHTHQVKHFNLTPRHSCITEGICHYGINLTRDLWLKFYLSDSSLYKLASVQFISLIPFQVPIYNLFIVQKEWRSRWNPEPTRTKIVCQIFFNLIVLSTDAYSDNLKTLFTFFLLSEPFPGWNPYLTGVGAISIVAAFSLTITGIVIFFIVAKILVPCLRLRRGLFLCNLW